MSGPDKYPQHFGISQSSNIFYFILKVKNKAPAPVQITAEQLLREAKERQLEIVPPVSFFSVHQHCIYYFSHNTNNT